MLPNKELKLTKPSIMELRSLTPVFGGPGGGMSDPGVADHAGDFVLVRNPIQDDQDDGGIPLSEWQAVASADPSLEPVEAMFGRNPATGARVRVPLAGGVKWIGHPVGVAMPFSWSNGQVLCYNLDQATLAKVRELADLLRAECIETPW